MSIYAIKFEDGSIGEVKVGFEKLIFEGTSEIKNLSYLRSYLRN